MAEVGDLFRDAGFTVPNAKAPWAVMAKNSPDYGEKFPITGTFGFQRQMVCRLVVEDEPEDWLARFARQKENYDA